MVDVVVLPPSLGRSEDGASTPTPTPPSPVRRAVLGILEIHLCKAVFAGGSARDECEAEGDPRGGSGGAESVLPARAVTAGKARQGAVPAVDDCQRCKLDPTAGDLPRGSRVWSRVCVEFSSDLLAALVLFVGGLLAASGSQTTGTPPPPVLPEEAPEARRI